MYCFQRIRIDVKTIKVAKYRDLQGAEIRVIECWLSSPLCHLLLILCPMAQGHHSELLLSNTDTYFKGRKHFL